MPRPYKLIALDLDGTLLNHEQQIPGENRDAIAQALDAGLTVCITTGRGVQSMLSYVEELGLKTPFVTANGGEVWKEPHKLWKRTPLDAFLVRQLYELALEHDVWYWGYTTEGLCDRRHPIDDVLAHTWLKFGFFSEDRDLLGHLQSLVSNIGEFEITNSSPLNLEINPKGVSKSSGLKEVCRRLGLEMSEVVAVGDSLNDLSMIRDAGWGVAMGNAQEAVKEAADWITASNDENGVALVIRRVLHL